MSREPSTFTLHDLQRGSQQSDVIDDITPPAPIRPSRHGQDITANLPQSRLELSHPEEEK